MQQIPGSRLLLHTPQGSHRNRIIKCLEERGISADRLETIGMVSPEEYFRIYQRIDIALDPFPYAGGTTTCDALWMGVPVVTLAGQSAIARSGVSILSNVGLPELIARTPVEYIQIVKALANDLPGLKHLRSTLRGRLQKSPLMDRPRYVLSIEQAYRAMWADGIGSSNIKK
jgi:protein O-GlcNAc transferase